MSDTERAAFNICLPSGEWKKWDNMTMDQRRSALMLGFASDDFPESDRKGKTKKWADLNAAEQTACNDLGWVQSTWDADDPNPFDTKQADLTIHQIKQIHLLGYTIHDFAN